MKIRDSVAFVTGANRGLGLAFAKELLGRGVKKLYAGVRNPDGVDLPGVIPVKFDVTNPAIAAVAARCNDVGLLINNAGIGRVDASALDPAVIDNAREIFETNFYKIIRASQAFTPVLSANCGGAIINVLSDVTWFARPMLTAHAATKSAAWSFTNALRIDVRDKGIQVLALHVHDVLAITNAAVSDAGPHLAQELVVILSSKFGVDEPAPCQALRQDLAHSGREPIGAVMGHGLLYCAISPLIGMRA